MRYVLFAVIFAMSGLGTAFADTNIVECDASRWKGNRTDFDRVGGKYETSTDSIDWGPITFKIDQYTKQAIVNWDNDEIKADFVGRQQDAWVVVYSSGHFYYLAAVTDQGRVMISLVKAGLPWGDTAYRFFNLCRVN